MSERVISEIERRRKALGLSTIKLAQEAGLGRDAVRDITQRGKSLNPSHETLSKIAKRLGCAVADLTGERPARAPAREHSKSVEIYELDVHVAAGLASEDSETVLASHEAAMVVGMHSYPADSFREAYGVSPARVRIVAVRGNSMEPELWSGQRVMVDVEDRTPSPPGVFVVWDGLALVCKFVEVVANSDPLRVRISSAHSAFQPYERNLEEAYINGRVIGVWARM